jgi:nucleoid DNA-binding protein
MKHDDRTERFVTRASHRIKIDMSNAKGTPLFERRAKQLKLAQGRARKSISRVALTREIARSAGLSQYQADIVLVSVLEQISRAVREGGEVRLAGFGTFAASGSDGKKVSVLVDKATKPTQNKPRRELAD